MKDLEETILQDCMERLQHGESLEQILKKYPGVRGLRSLLESVSLAQSLQSDLQVPNGAQIRSRTQFLEAAHKLEQRPARPFRFSFESRGLVVLLTLVVIMFGVVGSGIVSAKSLPGEPFYPLKLAAEQTRLWMTLNPADRLTLESTFEQRRLQDVENLIKSQKSSNVQVSFSGFLQVKGDDWFIENVPVVLPPNMGLNQDVQSGAFVDVTGTVGSNGSVLIEKINIHEVDFSGYIQSMQGINWVDRKSVV